MSDLDSLMLTESVPDKASTIARSSNPICCTKAQGQKNQNQAKIS